MLNRDHDVLRIPNCPGVSILCGDVLSRLAEIPDRSVQVCVTSPPYWALRDYGTARWEGGDSACDHRAPTSSTLVGSTENQEAASFYREVCGKCGARSVDSQIGLESTPEAFIARLVEVFREVRRVLRDDGTCWVNMGDSYANTGNADSSSVGGFTGDRIRAGTKGTMDSRPRNIPAGLKPKDLCGIPWRLAFALQADGWWLRQDIIWHKPAPMPESVSDRCTKSHEYIFLLSKRERYFFDAEAIKEKSVDKESIDGRRKRSEDKFVGQRFSETRGGFSQIEAGKTYPTRNLRSVWTISTQPFNGAHFAAFPPEIPRRAVLAGSNERACPHCGACWVRVVNPVKVFRDRPNAMTKRTGEDGTGNFAPNDVAGVSVRTLGFVPSCACHVEHGHQPIELPEFPERPVDNSVTANGKRCMPKHKKYLKAIAKWEDATGRVAADTYSLCAEVARTIPFVPSRVLDPFLGSGTTLAVACSLGRAGVGIELNPEYVALAVDRIGMTVAPTTHVPVALGVDPEESLPLFDLLGNDGEDDDAVVVDEAGSE